jgi:hypothetical protein
MTIQRAPAIEPLVRDARAAWRVGDVEVPEPMFSHEHEESLLFMGSDPSEVWCGRDEALRAAMHKAWTAMPGWSP